jgi:hypothetical protein
VHPGSGQWTDPGSHYPGLGQVDVGGLILLGYKALVAVGETLGYLSRSPTLGHITGWKDLPAQRKVDYHGFVAPYLISIDKKAAAGIASAK